MAKVGVDIVVTEKGVGVLKRTAGDIDRVGKRSKALSERFALLKKNFLGVTVAAAGLSLAMKKFIELSNVQEKAEAALAQAFASRGDLTREMIADTKRFASELQKLTGIGDETTLMVAAMFVPLGLNADLLKRVVTLTADLATVSGTEMIPAQRRLVAMMTGSISTLRQYVENLDEADIKQRGIVSIVEQLEAAIGGQAIAFGQTGAGQIAVFNAALGDTGEILGDIIKQILVKLMPAFNAIIGILGPTMLTVISALQVAFASLFTAILKPFALLEEGLNFLGVHSDRTFQRLVESGEKLVFTYSDDLVEAVKKFGGTSVEELNKATMATKELTDATKDLARKAPKRPELEIPELPEPPSLEDFLEESANVKERFVDLSVTADDVGATIENSFNEAARGMVNAMTGAQVSIEQILLSIARSFIELGIRAGIGAAIAGPPGAAAGAASAATSPSGAIAAGAVPATSRERINVVLQGTMEGQDFQSKTFPNFEITRKRRKF